MSSLRGKSRILYHIIISHLSRHFIPFCQQCKAISRENLTFFKVSVIVVRLHNLKATNEVCRKSGDSRCRRSKTLRRPAEPDEDYGWMWLWRSLFSEMPKVQGGRKSANLSGKRTEYETGGTPFFRVIRRIFRAKFRGGHVRGLAFFCLAQKKMKKGYVRSGNYRKYR